MNTVIAAEFEAALRRMEDLSQHWSLQDSLDMIVLASRYRAECWPHLTKNQKHELHIRLEACKRGRPYPS